MLQLWKKGPLRCSMQGKVKRKQRVKGDNNKSNDLFPAISRNLLHTGVWCVDRVASSHLCCDRNKFCEFEQYEKEIILADNNRMLTTARGVIRLKTNMSEMRFCT